MEETGQRTKWTKWNLKIWSRNSRDVVTAVRRDMRHWPVMGRPGGLVTLMVATLALARSYEASEDAERNVTSQSGGWPVATARGALCLWLCIFCHCLNCKRVIYPRPLTTLRESALALRPDRGVDRGAAVSSLGPHGLLLRGGNWEGSGEWAQIIASYCLSCYSRRNEINISSAR